MLSEEIVYFSVLVVKRSLCLDIISVFLLISQSKRYSDQILCSFNKCESMKTPTDNPNIKNFSLLSEIGSNRSHSKSYSFQRIVDIPITALQEFSNLNVIVTVDNRDMEI